MIKFRSVSNSGFTLMELMTVVAIVAVLAAIAFPSYQEQIRRARRADGQAALMHVAIAQERYRADCIRYAGSLTGTRNCDADGSPPYALGLTLESEEGYYRLALSGAGTYGFIARAEALGDQARDRAGGVPCQSLTIDQDGNRAPGDCW